MMKYIYVRLLGVVLRRNNVSRSLKRDMQIGRPLMSDSTATDNFARPIIRERTEFGSDPDFSPTSISKTYIGVEKINSTSRENSQSRQCHSELYLL